MLQGGRPIRQVLRSFVPESSEASCLSRFFGLSRTGGLERDRPRYNEAMNRITRISNESLGCELQSEVSPAGWRWSSPCPFFQSDVSEVCLNCLHLKAIATSDGVRPPEIIMGGEPV